MQRIVEKHDPVLRQMAKEVPISEISTPEIQKILSDMKEVLATQEDGVALAAPQIGVSLRIFVVSPKVPELLVGKDREMENENVKKKKSVELVYINPVISKLSREKHDLEEGCLSARYLYGKIKRSARATVEAYDENGKKFVRGGSGLLAQIFQHETDHLNGILFIDSAKDIVDVPPEELAEKKAARIKSHGE